jgi:hypothetical protein
MRVPNSGSSDSLLPLAYGRQAIPRFVYQTRLSQRDACTPPDDTAHGSPTYLYRGLHPEPRVRRYRLGFNLSSLAVYHAGTYGRSEALP